MRTLRNSGFDALLPDSVVTVQVGGDVAGAILLGAEPERVARAVPSRRREYATVRHCARAGMARLGVAAAPILHGEGGQPIWPQGVVGSMTHCPGLRAASVARARDLRSIGIDAEPHAPLPDGVLVEVADEEERGALDTLAALDPSVHWDRLLFSAKESSYKAWYPLVGGRLMFTEANVDLDPDGGFEARFPTAGDSRDGLIHGTWTIVDGLVLTAVTVPGDRPSSPEARS